MVLVKGTGDFFALDIGTNAVRVVQLRKTGQDSYNLMHFGYAQVNEKVVQADSSVSNRQLGEIILTAIGQSGIKTRDVVIGYPSNKTFTTVIDLPNMNEAELKSTIKYQMDQYIPMAAEETKADWALLGQSLHDPKQIEVLLASTSNSFSEERLEFIESLGLNVVAAEPDSLAMVRSLLPPNIQDARLLIDLGESATDIVITYGGNPRLVRNIPTGMKTFVKAAVSNLAVKEDQAKQFILKFGLAPDRLEGQVFRAIEGSLDSFSLELVKSIKFFQTRYPNSPVGGIILSGYASIVPQIAEYITAKTGIGCSIGNPWQSVSVSQADQSQLAPVASEFATVIGLAQREAEK